MVLDQALKRRLRAASASRLADRVQVPRQIFFDARLATDAVVIEHNPVARDVERELATALRQQNRRFSESLRVPQFVEDVGIATGAVRDDHVSPLYHQSSRVLEWSGRSRQRAHIAVHAWIRRGVSDTDKDNEVLERTAL